MKEKRRFDNIIQAFSYANKIKYVKTKRGKEKCMIGTIERQGMKSTTFIAIDMTIASVQLLAPTTKMVLRNPVTGNLPTQMPLPGAQDGCWGC